MVKLAGLQNREAGCQLQGEFDADIQQHQCGVLPQLAQGIDQ